MNLLDQLKMSQKLKDKCIKAGFTSVESILRHYPSRYETVEEKAFISWTLGEKIVIEGLILQPVKVTRLRGNLSLCKFKFQTKTGLFNVTIFNRPWIAKIEKEITLFARYDGDFNLTATNYNTLSIQQQLGIHSVYGLSHTITMAEMSKCIEASLNHLKECEFSEIPSLFANKYRLLKIKQAIYLIHKPNSDEALSQAIRTLKYEELLRFQTKILYNRYDKNLVVEGQSKIFDRRDILKHMEFLPFSLTQDQRKVLDEILNDLQSNRQMYRLLQGDVGSGKTIIAALAIYACVLSHHQAALLVPTEILAKQHYESLVSYLPDSIRVEVLYAGLSNVKRNEILAKLAKNEIDCLIGTHALIQDDVIFYDCGLVVADEQHRFGVQQRRKLSSKGDKVDFLLMSATPIPRTLANVIFGDLDVSTIEQYHQTKRSIHTQFIQENTIKPILQSILDKIAEGNQVYVVCPAIDENSMIDTKNVTQVYKALKTVLPTEIKIEMMHGRLSSDQTDRVLKAFYAHQIDILVSTTVIEVGVNVMNANVMVVYDADRFGLSQLHQLRGRLARGEKEGYCYVLSASSEDLAIKRLTLFASLSNGFEIAQKDLELRGPGDVFGLKQSGIPSFSIANVILDSKILAIAREDALMMLKQRLDNDFSRYIEFCRLEQSIQNLD